MKLCMGCMEQIGDDVATCPYCGFNEGSLRQESYYLDPGTVVGGRYIVGRVLSYGGHTVSYLGMDAAENRKVVVKEYLPSDFSTRSEGDKDVTIYSGDGQVQFGQGLENFLNEANRIEHLQNPEGIAKVYDCLVENETGYVVSEYVRGRTLQQILREGKKYSPQEASDFICKILRGLSDIHDMDIVHCDISPDTIIVTDTGEIKLMDFGATRYVTTANSKSLSIILKRGYAPEEQYRSKGKRGPWTDVYALGAVMYQMITGILPRESVERALEDDLKEPSKMGIEIPKDMENALMNALNVYQAERTPSARVFLEELSSSNVKRIKVKQKRNKMGKFPLWAKGLVACLACIVVAGGIYMFQRIAGGGPDSLGGDTVIMPDLRGKTWEEAEVSIQELNEKYGWEIELQENKEQSVFDLKQKNGTVCTQSVQSGAELYNPGSEEQNEQIKGDISCDEKGKLSGSITIAFYSNKELYYREISGMNAWELSKKLKMDLDDYGEMIEDNEKNYFDLRYLDVDGVLIKPRDLKIDGNKVIDYSKVNKIYYYASEFFYWKALPDFTSYESIDCEELSNQSVYEYINEKKIEEKGKKALRGSSLVDDGYVAFDTENYKKGQIVEQTVEAGQEYNESNPGDTQLKIKVIDAVFSFKNKTGDEFLNEIGEYYPSWHESIVYGFTTESGKDVSRSGGRSWEISDVQIFKLNDDRKGGNSNEPRTYFKFGQGEEEGAFLNFIVKEPVIIEPEPEEEPSKWTPSTPYKPKSKQPSAKPTPEPQPTPTTPESQPASPSDDLNHDAGGKIT